MPPRVVSSGTPAFDETVQGLWLGDNVVWQVDRLEDYARFAEPFVARALSDGRTCLYVRFAPHPPVLSPRPGLRWVEVDPARGFDVFCAEVHRLIEEAGREAFYVFDSLSSLVVEWATDEQVANFFQVTCPYLFELDTVAFFALLRGQHDHSAIARIRDTTQLLIDVYHARGELYVHPVKVWQRYSPQMFLPHLVSSGRWEPVAHSGKAAAVSATGRGHPLHAAVSSSAPWESVYRKLLEYRGAAAEWPGAPPEATELKQELCRMMLGSHPQFNPLADRYLALEDLFAIRERVIGSGRIGGKAAGMLLARAILLQEGGEPDFAAVLENHDSFYIGSDVFFTFLVNNDLFRLRLELARREEYTWDHFREVQQRFLGGAFPADILAQFRDLLDYFGQAPIIVRSSSFLEDSFGNAFAGKYRSEFCPNQGAPQDRLQAFLRAVKLVYASSLNPDSLSYRRDRGLAGSDEQMAILVQRVAGMPYAHTFFPPLAGVAFSRNLYAWNDRIDPARGVIRLVFGLGTRAVDRVGGDYPRMIAVSHPELRPEVGPRIAKYSQRHADVLDLQANRLVSVPVPDLLAHGPYPHLHYLVSVLQDGEVYDPVTTLLDAPPDRLVLTFNRLIARTPFVSILGQMLATLDRTYGQPVDIEFTASVNGAGHVTVNLLQCRPMGLPASTAATALPQDVPPDRVLFRTTSLIGGSTTRDLPYIVYVDPRRYAAADLDTKKSLGPLIGRINRHPEIAAHKALVIGPGRWGTSNVLLGVHVGYADIDNAAALVEVAHEEAGQVPEVSHGTHFFQDLVEADITYLAVYPGEEGAAFHRRFFETAPSVLADLVPGAEPFAPLVRVIHVPAAAQGARARLVADAASRRALCYLP